MSSLNEVLRRHFRDRGLPMPASLMRPGESVEDGAAVEPRPGKRSKTSGDGEAGGREISRHARAIYPYKAPKATAGVWPSYQVRWERERMLSRAPHCLAAKTLRRLTPRLHVTALHCFPVLSRFNRRAIDFSSCGNLPTRTTTTQRRTETGTSSSVS